MGLGGGREVPDTVGGGEGQVDVVVHAGGGMCDGMEGVEYRPVVGAYVYDNKV